LDEETQRYAQILKIKQARLFELDKQAAKYGIDVPPHIEMERVSLHDELAMVESAIRSPARAETADELGPAGRFKANRQDQADTRQLIAAVLNKLDSFIEQSEAWRDVNRQVLLIIGIAVILILIAVVAITTYLLTTGHL
jgi:uncharacterized membrane protein